MRRWLPWVALVVVVGVALTVGASRSGHADTVDARSARLAREVRCPTCRGLSALVWALPVVALVCGAGGLAFAFRRWKVAGP